MVANVGYAREINKQIKAGASVKYISQELDDETGKGAGLDIGLLYQPEIKGLILGAAIQNVGLSKVKFAEKEEGLPLTIKTGAGYRIKKALIGIDIAKPRGNSLQFNLGGEYQIHPSMALRAGFNSSIDECPGVTAGFGVTYKNLTFNGAYLPSGEFDSTFQLSASMRF